MDAKTAVSVDEYLHTSFPDLDQEYRDGELVERALPDILHSRTQLLLGVFFETRRKELSVYACPELRLKVRDRLYRIPDVAIFHPMPPAAGIPDTPPLIAIEILSPDDRLAAVREKLEEYHQWGVKHVWLVDPHQRRMYVCNGGLREVASLRIPELNLELNPGDIFEFHAAPTN